MEKILDELKNAAHEDQLISVLERLQAMGHENLVPYKEELTPFMIDLIHRVDFDEIDIPYGKGKEVWVGARYVLVEIEDIPGMIKIVEEKLIRNETVNILVIAGAFGLMRRKAKPAIPLLKKLANIAYENKSRESLENIAHSIQMIKGKKILFCPLVNASNEEACEYYHYDIVDSDRLIHIGLLLGFLALLFIVGLLFFIKHYRVN